jgi:uracil phosphoribosyltransferase
VPPSSCASHAPLPPSTLPLSPQLFYVKLPADIANRTVLLVDPMLATGQSASLAIRELAARGVPEERILFLNVVACPEGLAVLAARHPAVRVVTAAVDEGLNAQKYIVPGLGDFGDRYFGTEERG